MTKSHSVLLQPLGVHPLEWFLAAMVLIPAGCLGGGKGASSDGGQADPPSSQADGSVSNPDDDGSVGVEAAPFSAVDGGPTGQDAGAGACATSCAAGTVCNPFIGTCVACRVDADCKTNQTCLNNVCVGTCKNSLDCAAPTSICDPVSSRCVECVSAADCDGVKQCFGRVCRTPCQSDKTCTPEGLLCNLAAGACAACVSQADCRDGGSCEEGVCRAAVCAPSRSVCLGAAIATCNANGTALTSTTVCPLGACLDTAQGAVCTNPTADVQTVDDSGPIDTCAPPKAGYSCDAVPHFPALTQVVDGVGDEFCGLPAVSYNVNDAPFAEGRYNGDPAPVGFPEVVTFRAAWSPEAFHLHAHVSDPAISTGATLPTLWDGDEVEVLIGSAPTVSMTSCTLGAGALHVGIAPPTAGTTARGVIYRGSGTGDALPTAWYAARLVDDGYEVELRIPWPDATAPRTQGATISFHFGVSVKDSSASLGRQLYGALPVPSVTSSCCERAAPWCDGTTWCHPVLQ